MSSPPSTNSNLSPANLLVGATVSLFEVTTLGQPLEVLKTHLAANRSDNLRTAIKKTYARGGLLGFHQGLIPWAWIESGTTGAILIFTSSYGESLGIAKGFSKGSAGLVGGVCGGVAQAYLAMGVCTCMKTAEITRVKMQQVPSTVPGEAGRPAHVPSTWKLFMDMYKEGGIRGINKGATRMGFARAAESLIRETKDLNPEDSLDSVDKMLTSAIGGFLGCWNHPIEVVRVEMQSMHRFSNLNAPKAQTMVGTAKYIYHQDGLKGFFRGVTPRIGLGVWRTICLVSVADYAKDAVHNAMSNEKPPS